MEEQIEAAGGHAVSNAGVKRVLLYLRMVARRQ